MWRSSCACAGLASSLAPICKSAEHRWIVSCEHHLVSNHSPLTANGTRLTDPTPTVPCLQNVLRSSVNLMRNRRSHNVGGFPRKITSQTPAMTAGVTCL